MATMATPPTTMRRRREENLRRRRRRRRKEETLSSLFLPLFPGLLLLLFSLLLLATTNNNQHVVVGVLAQQDGGILAAPADEVEVEVSGELLTSFEDEEVSETPTPSNIYKDEEEEEEEEEYYEEEEGEEEYYEEGEETSILAGPIDSEEEGEVERHGSAARENRRKSSSPPPQPLNVRAADVNKNPDQPNLLWIVTDQQRFDTIRLVQNNLREYDGKTKIETPNIDRLIRRGVVFENGVTRNKLVNSNVINKMSFIRLKVNQLETFEQILVDEKGYQAETYGKWHAPFRFFNSRKDATKRIMSYNQFDFRKGRPIFQYTQVVKPHYRRSLKHLFERDGTSCPPYKNGDQMNPWSYCPYTPNSMDPRSGMATNTALSQDSGLTGWEVNGENHSGEDSLDEEYTSTGVIGMGAFRALSRLISRGVPFSLSVHFNGPHPPITAPSKYVQPYLEKKDKIFVSPSITDPMDNSAYKDLNGRFRINDERYGWKDEDKVKDITATYYGMITEIDVWVGKFLDRLREYGIADKTMIVFTSDHGEMMGAHAMRNKFNFLEESARVPLIISYPQKIPKNKWIKEPVSHIDLFSTILDYLGAKEFDKSDGTSLRSKIAGTAFNKLYDENSVVCELDERVPKSAVEFDNELGSIPNFMVRKGSWKLMLPKLRDSPVIDMMYHLDTDPGEIHNYLGSNAMQLNNTLIGKAEHLKALLWEYLNRADGVGKYYSDPKYNRYVGEGDMAEVVRRRTWREVDYWQSEADELPFGQPVKVRKVYKRNEYLYIGRTTVGDLQVDSVEVVGPDARHFKVAYNRKIVNRWWWAKIKVQYLSFENLPIDSLDATVVIRTDTNRVRQLKIVAER